MKAQRYKSAPYFDGSATREQKAYAANNSQEYFAEITEAYFGKDDYYPFNRSELGMHGPKGYAMLRKVRQNSVFDPNAASS